METYPFWVIALGIFVFWGWMIKSDRQVNKQRSIERRQQLAAERKMREEAEKAEAVKHRRNLPGPWLRLSETLIKIDDCDLRYIALNRFVRDRNADLPSLPPEGANVFTQLFDSDSDAKELLGPFVASFVEEQALETLDFTCPQCQHATARKSRYCPKCGVEM